MNAAENLPPIDSPEIPVPIVPPADRVNVRLERPVHTFEFDIPLPRGKGRPRESRQAQPIPFGKIPVGASYFARGVKQSTASSAATAYRKRHDDLLFVTAWFDSDPKYRLAGVRIWRVR